MAVSSDTFAVAYMKIQLKVSGLISFLLRNRSKSVYTFSVLNSKHYIRILEGYYFWASCQTVDQNIF